MKHYIIFLALITTIFTCKAQSPVVSLDTFYQDTVEGVYFKDLNNELNKFVGTWVYNDGNTTLVIQLQKVVQHYNGEWYEDLLIGEYQYIENGVEVFNSLSRLNSPLVNNAQHYLDGNQLLKKTQIVSCEDCDIAERRVLLFFSDPERKYLHNKLAVRYVDNNGVESIEVKLVSSGSYVSPYENAPKESRVPYGNYTLIKL